MFITAHQEARLSRFAMSGSGTVGSAAQFDFHMADSRLRRQGPPILTMVLAKTRRVGAQSCEVSIIRGDVEAVYLKAATLGGRLRATKFRDSGEGLLSAPRDKALALAVLESFFAKPADYDLSDAQDALALHLARSVGHDVTDIAGLWFLNDRGFMVESERFINDLPALMDRELLRGTGGGLGAAA